MRRSGWRVSSAGDVLLGGHNDLYPANTIAPGAFAEAVARYGPRQKGHVLQPGELYLYVRR